MTEASYTFDFQSEVSPNSRKRTIEGLIVSFDRAARFEGQWYKFLPGSLKWEDLRWVKLLRDHDNAQVAGYAIDIRETPQGYMGVFKVPPGQLGDEVLLEASMGNKDGFSIGVDFKGEDFTRMSGVNMVHRADLRETSITGMPSFNNSRVTKVTMAREGVKMFCQHCGQPDHGDGVMCPSQAKPTNGPVSPTFTIDQLAQMQALFGAQNKPVPEVKVEAPKDGPKRETVPVRAQGATFVNESVPYRFDRGGNFTTGGTANFSDDLKEMARFNDQYGRETAAGKRVMDLIKAEFATVSTDINELNPPVNRPGMYVDQKDYRYPLWNAVNKGSLSDNTPFFFPKYNSSSGLVGDHTEGVEPTPGSFTTTSQTIAPSGLSGKASITREVWDAKGNPQVSTLIWNQMKRGWFEGLEAYVSTSLAALASSIADITIPAGGTDAQVVAAWEDALADLQFIRGGGDRFSMFAIEKNLYKKFAAAKASDGRPFYPIIAPSNVNGLAAKRFRLLDLAGVIGVPAWALPATAGSPNNSWLFDPEDVHAWASAPQRLEFPGTDADGDYAPVAMIDLGIWGYKAFAVSDVTGVRQVTYDTTA